jgi:hypothetical protein
VVRARGTPRFGGTGAALSVAFGVVISACARNDGPKLEKTEDDVEIPIPEVPEPPVGGPSLGALSDVTPVLDRPSRRGVRLGYLHAGAVVTRAREPIGVRGCEAGWFPIRPKGFVCASGTATTDLHHPTLIAMALRPNLTATLPYTYARTTRDTTIFEPDPARIDAVRKAGSLRDSSGLAVVGSWTARDPAGAAIRLAMTTDGRFVPTADLRAATPSTFAGKALTGGGKLPVAFVVKRGVHRFQLRGGVSEKESPLEYHSRVDLTGRYTTTEGTEFWETGDGAWVRLKDVTLIRERRELPSFATGSRRWLDVSVVTSTLVAYEGKKPVFATLVSVGRDRLGAPDGPGRPNAVTERGEFEVVAKYLTVRERDPDTFAENVSLHDAPWALELSSGKLLVGAYWHDRFGIEHGPGNIELSPSDAAWVFRFATPALPEGWHAAARGVSAENSTIVNVRK